MLAANCHAHSASRTVVTASDPSAKYGRTYVRKYLSLSNHSVCMQCHSHLLIMIAYVMKQASILTSSTCGTSFMLSLQVWGIRELHWQLLCHTGFSSFFSSPSSSSSRSVPIKLLCASCLASVALLLVFDHSSYVKMYASHSIMMRHPIQHAKASCRDITSMSAIHASIAIAKECDPTNHDMCTMCQTDAVYCSTSGCKQATFDPHFDPEAVLIGVSFCAGRGPHMDRLVKAMRSRLVAFLQNCHTKYNRLSAQLPVCTSALL